MIFFYRLVLLIILSFVYNINAKDIHDPLKQSDPLYYYHLHFKPKKKKHWLHDTLFEKTVWDRKVSHIVIEQKENYSWVTLLMIKPKADVYKSQNYAIHYQFKDHKRAIEKYFWLDDFISRRGVLRVKLLGKVIISETILFKGYGKKISNN